MFKSLLFGGCALVLSLATALPMQAQKPPAPQPAPAKPAAPATPVSQGEMQKFALAVKQILTINQSSETQAIQAIRGEGLTEQRFTEILTSKTNPQQKPKTPVQPKEQQGYDRAVTKLVQIQKDNETKAEQAVRSQGLDVTRFNQIFEQVRSNPQMRQQVQQMIRQ
jgi:hypothetical protein